MCQLPRPSQRPGKFELLSELSEPILGHSKKSSRLRRGSQAAEADHAEDAGRGAALTFDCRGSYGGDRHREIFILDSAGESPASVQLATEDAVEALHGAHQPTHRQLTEERAQQQAHGRDEHQIHDEDLKSYNMAYEETRDYREYSDDHLSTNDPEHPPIGTALPPDDYYTANDNYYDDYGGDHGYDEDMARVGQGEYMGDVDHSFRERRTTEHGSEVNPYRLSGNERHGLLFKKALSPGIGGEDGLLRVPTASWSQPK